MDFYNLIPALKSIRDIPETLLEEFEDCYRSTISSVDIKHLTSGIIPKHILSTSLTSTLETVSQSALNMYESTRDPRLLEISAMLWNPLLAAMFKMTSTETPSRSFVRAASSESTSPRAPKPKAQTPNRSTPPPPVKMGPAQVDGLRKRLKNIMTSKTSLYATPAHAFIKCVKTDCEFCRSLFTTLNITRCEGHKKCCSIGWYPHIGLPLWKMTKKRHDQNLPFNLSMKPCKEHEIPAIGNPAPQDVATDVIPSCGIGSPDYCSDNMAYDDESPTRPQSPPGVLSSTKRSWSREVDDVEALYLRMRAAKAVKCVDGAAGTSH